MEAVTDPALHHLPVNLRHLQSAAGFQPPHQTLASQLGTDFDSNNFQAYPTIDEIPRGQVNGAVTSGSYVPQANPQTQHRPQLQNQQVNGHHAPHHSPIHQNAQSSNGTFDASAGPRYAGLSPTQGYSAQPPLNLYTPVRALQQQENSPGGLRGGTNDHSPNGNKEDGGGHFSGMKLVKEPPDLDQWRERLFNVDDIVTLTEDEFQTYFPHIDNVYSHRSTQKYKRKPFVSHYWDCRLKGRPPGTPKSSDPNKKKRRRTARERDLCDVKIKITEYFPGAAAAMAQPDFASSIDGDTGSTMNYLMDATGGTRGGQTDNSPSQPFGILAPSSNLPAGHPGANGARYYTIQRINGNTTSNSNDRPDTPTAAASQHKHTLEESDRVKKNSVQRSLLKEEKERKRSAAGAPNRSTQQPNTNTNDSTSPIHLNLNSPVPTSGPSGPASSTAKRHANPVNPDSGLILYGNAFCPFAQRVWIALEIKQIPYQYVEVIPEHMVGGSGMRPPGLLEVNPTGTVPCVRHGNWGAWESGVVMEYLEDLSIGHPLLPLGDPQLRAHCRLWTDHINRKVLPAFYALLLTPPQLSNHNSTATPSPPSPAPLHMTLTSTLHTAITALVNASHVTGPFFLGPSISFVDVAFAPWIIRLSRVLKYYRQWPDPEVGSRWEAWVAAIENDERVMATVSDEGSYHGVYREAGCGGTGSFAESTKGKAMAEVEFAKRVMRQEGFGLGGDVWGPLDGSSELLREMDRRQERG